MSAKWTSAFDWGQNNFTQDRCENAPFASVGGLDKRTAMVAPPFVPEDEQAEYLRGYQHAAMAAYGDDWQTCAFGWKPALTIND
jgi:hypothetical protein